MELSQPLLVSRDTSGAPRLRGVACSTCGSTSFPPQQFGCETCGAFGSSLSPADIDARGVVVSSAQVDHYRGDDVEVPFRIAEILLDSGFKVRVTLDRPEPVPNGTRVAGVLRPVHSTDAGESMHELRFAPERNAHDQDAR